MIPTPHHVQCFETLSLAAIVLGLLHGFAVSGDGPLGAIVTAAIMVTLTLLASRGRKSWVRWVLLLMSAFGMALMVWQTEAVLSTGYPFLTAVVTVMQAVALVLLFTSQSASWFRTRQSQS